MLLEILEKGENSAKTRSFYINLFHTNEALSRNQTNRYTTFLIICLILLRNWRKIKNVLFYIIYTKKSVTEKIELEPSSILHSFVSYKWSIRNQTNRDIKIPQHWNKKYLCSQKRIHILCNLGSFRFENDYCLCPWKLPYYKSILLQGHKSTGINSKIFWETVWLSW